MSDATGTLLDVCWLEQFRRISLENLIGRSVHALAPTFSEENCPYHLVSGYNHPMKGKFRA